MSDARTMLPPTSPDLAKAMDILEERLFALPVGMITKDPWQVPESLLDHLAWENSVDIWDFGWSEEVKRNVIAVAAEVHRYKGTPYGIKKALSVFGVTVELEEWWQAGVNGTPGTFTARLFVTNPLDGSDELELSDAVVKAMKAVLYATAPVSRRADLQVGVQVTPASYVGVHFGAYVKATAVGRTDLTLVLDFAREAYAVHPWGLDRYEIDGSTLTLVADFALKTYGVGQQA